MFFSLASVSFYCKGCTGIFFLKSSTPPPLLKSQMVRPLIKFDFWVKRRIFFSRPKFSGAYADLFEISCRLERLRRSKLKALRTELPVICVTSILRSCLCSSHFACPASSIKLTNWRIFRAGFEHGSCFFRASFVPFSSLVRAIFEPGSCLVRAWFVPFSSLVRSIFEPGSFHFRAWFVPFSCLVRAIFDPAFYPFRARLVPFSNRVHASLRCNRLISFAKKITTGYMISYYILLVLSIASVLTWRNALRSVL